MRGITSDWGIPPQRASNAELSCWPGQVVKQSSCWFKTPWSSYSYVTVIQSCSISQWLCLWFVVWYHILQGYFTGIGTKITSLILGQSYDTPGPCFTTATWRGRKNFSQWERELSLKAALPLGERLRQHQEMALCPWSEDCVLSMWGEIMISMYRLYDNTAYVDSMDLAVRCSRKAVKLNHSLTHSPMKWPNNFSITIQIQRKFHLVLSCHAMCKIL